MSAGCGGKVGGCEAPCPSPSPTAGEKAARELLSRDGRRFVEDLCGSRDYSTRTVSDLTCQPDTGMFVPSLGRVWGSTSARGKAWVLQKWAGDTVPSPAHGAVQDRGGKLGIHSVKPEEFISSKGKERKRGKKAFLRKPPGERALGWMLLKSLLLYLHFSNTLQFCRGQFSLQTTTD